MSVSSEPWTNWNKPVGTFAPTLLAGPPPRRADACVGLPVGRLNHVDACVGRCGLSPSPRRRRTAGVRGQGLSVPLDKWSHLAYPERRGSTRRRIGIN